MSTRKLWILLLAFLYSCGPEFTPTPRLIEDVMYQEWEFNSADFVHSETLRNLRLVNHNPDDSLTFASLALNGDSYTLRYELYFETLPEDSFEIAPIVVGSSGTFEIRSQSEVDGFGTVIEGRIEFRPTNGPAFSLSYRYSNIWYYADNFGLSGFLHDDGTYDIMFQGPPN